MSLVGLRGIPQMISNIEATVPATWLQPRPQTPIIRMGAFSCLEILIAVRGCTKDHTLFFEVGEGGRLHQVRTESELLVDCLPAGPRSRSV